MSARRILVSFTCMLVLVVFALNVTAQERGTIEGTILDSSGAAVAGAKVTATNVATGVGTSAASSGNGLYNIPDLTPGTYRVGIEKEGFKHAVRDNVVVSLSADVGVNFTLEVGSMTQVVEVTAAAPMLKTENIEVSTSIPPQAMTDLPLTASGSRSPANFVFLTPGTTGDTFNTHISGGQTFASEIETDGLTVQSNPHAIFRQLSTQPPEAVQEASVAAGTYSAEYSTGGGVARFITRGGTNQFHGNLYEFNVNTAYNARGFYQPQVPNTKQNEYGGSFGGPIRIPFLYNGRDKSFFFVNINLFKNNSGNPESLLSVPTAAMKQGDFSEILSQYVIYDPATTVCSSGVCTRQAFAGNIIPSSRLSTVSKNYSGYLPNPIYPGYFNNWLANGQNLEFRHYYTFRVDHRIGNNHSLTGTMNWNYLNDTFGGNFPEPAGGSIIQPVQGPVIRVAYDWIISPTTTNHFAWGLNIQHQYYQIGSYGQGWPQKLGLTNVFNAQFPQISAGQYSFSNSGGSGEGYNRFWHIGIPMADDVSMVRGKQHLKFGFNLLRLHVDQAVYNGIGQYSFGNLETASTSSALQASTGFPFASFMLGDVDSAVLIDTNNIKTQARTTYIGLYAQDDIKLRPHFTLNLGVRWDAFIPYYDVNNYYSVMDPTVPNPAAGNLPGAMVYAGSGAGHYGSSRLPGANHTDHKNFGPHIGLAWEVKPSWVVRSGYQITYFPSLVEMFGGVRNSDLGFTAQPTFASTNTGITPAFNWDGGFPSYQTPPFIDPGFAVGSAVWEWHKGWYPPYQQNWSFNIQHQLRSNWLVDVGYVGTKGTRLSTGNFNENQVNPKYLALGNMLNLPMTDPSVIAAGFTPPYPGFTGNLNQALRPFPQYLSVGTTPLAVGGAVDAVNIGNSDYHSLQIKVEKHYSQGLYVLSSFTWAKLLTDSDSAWGGFFGSSSRDFYNRRLQKGLAASDIAARGVTAFNYELPIGPGKKFATAVHGAVGKIIGGWEINGILTYQDSPPLSVGANDTLPIFNEAQYADRVPGVPIRASYSGKFDPATDRYLNVGAWAPPAPFTIGNGPVFLSQRGFPFLNENIGLIKRTYITERVNLEIRAEFFNIFNRVQFGASGGNVNNPDSFGIVGSQANIPRQGQLAGKINF